MNKINSWLPSLAIFHFIKNESKYELEINEIVYKVLLYVWGNKRVIQLILQHVQIELQTTVRKTLTSNAKVDIGHLNLLLVAKRQNV